MVINNIMLVYINLFIVVCLDIDECNLNISMCQPDSYCDNTIGSYLCICNVGYSGDGFINCTSKFRSPYWYMIKPFNCLIDINECEVNAHDCDDNAACNDTIGSFICACNFGYSGNGTFCSKSC